MFTDASVYGEVVPLFVDPLSGPIAQGRTAQLYRWAPGKVLKLYRDGWPNSEAVSEARCARYARSVGLTVPVVWEVLHYHGRPGLVYDYCEAPSLLNRMACKPWTVFGAARVFARVHASVHQDCAPDLESQRDRLARKICAAEGLTASERADLLRLLRALPVGDRLCHGDFHPGNVLIGKSGPIIVDWADATRGNPWADVAQTSLLFRVTRLPVATPHPRMVGLGRSGFHWLYLRDYARHCPSDWGEFAAWLPLVAAARLYDGTADERPALLALIRRRG